MNAQTVKQDKDLDFTPYLFSANENAQQRRNKATVLRERLKEIDPVTPEESLALIFRLNNWDEVRVYTSLRVDREKIERLKKQIEEGTIKFS